MTIAQKLVTVAENIPEIYEAGKKSMIDENRIITSTATGSVISLNDISEVPHNVDIQVSGNGISDYSLVEISVYGESLIKPPFQDGCKTENGITFTDNGDGTVTANGTATADTTYVFKNIMLSGTYTLNGTQSGSTSTYFMGLGSSDHPDIGYGVTRTYATETAQNIFIRIKSGVTVNQTVFSPICEKGGSSKVTYRPSKSGTVTVKSTSPYMHILTNDRNVNLMVKYQQSWGMKKQYDRFWDDYQQNGSRTGYMFGFAGDGWTAVNFKPKYDINVTYGYMTFRKSNASIDMVEMCLNQGIAINFAGCTDFTQTFSESRFTRIGEIDTTAANVLNTTFYGSAARIIDKIILKSDGSQTFPSAFGSCFYLEDIRFEGTVGNSIDVHWSTRLSAESYDSIFSCLSATAIGQTLTLPTTAESTYDAKYGQGAWTRITEAHSNWDFQYA